MDLLKFGEELKKARLEKQVSLMDISFSTRINIKFLEAIESGKFSVLPQTYVRAFLREYGEAIGMGSDEILRKYDTLREPQASTIPREPNLATKSAAESPVRPSRPKEKRIPVTLTKNVLLAAVLLTIGASVLILRRSANKSPDATQEVPFDAVVKESEASTFKPDTLSSVVLPPPAVHPDSLHLEMTTTDSVWVSILVDGRKTLEYLFPPNRKRTFSAKDEFSITIGNAGGASFKLNGKELGTLGKRGAVIRNALINEASLKSL